MVRKIFTKNNIIVLSIGIVVGIIIISLIVSPMLRNTLNFNSKVTDKDNNTNNEEVVVTPSPSASPSSTGTKEEVTNTKTPSITPTPTTTPTTTVTATPTPSTSPVIVKTTEEQLVTYFQTENTSIDSLKDENNQTFREKAKTIFTNTIDFIFYDKEIKGYTFKELTLMTKLKIMKIALTIDNKIDSYFPNYKDQVKSTYSSIKTKLVVLYLSTTSKLCEQVGGQTCTQARSDFKTMKESFGFTFSLIKSGASNLKVVIEEWYQSIK